MQRHLRPGTHGARVQLAAGGPALEGQMLVDDTTRTNPCGPCRQRLGPLPPLLPVELCQSRPGLLLLLCLSSPQDIQQGLCCWFMSRILPTVVGTPLPVAR